MAALTQLCLLIASASFSAAYPFVSQMPTAENTDYGIILVTVLFGVDNPIIGSGIPEFYILQYRKEGEAWKNFAFDRMPDLDYSGRYMKNWTISGLESGVVYNVRVVLVDENKQGYEGDLVPYYIVPTKCDLPDNYDYRTGVSRVGPSLLISWNYENSSDRWCPVLQYQVSWAVGTENWHSRETTVSPFLLRDVIQSSDMFTASRVQLRVRVRAVTTGGYAPYSDIVTYPPEFKAYLSQPPTGENTGYGTIMATVILGKKNPVLGLGTAHFYTLQLRKEGEPWTDFITAPVPDLDTDNSYQTNWTISGLESGVVYNMRVVLGDESMEMYDADLVPYYIVPTMCYFPDVYDYNVTSYVTGDTLIVYWNYTKANAHWCPLLQYQVFWTSIDNETHTKEMTQSWIQLPQVDINGEIRFRVRAVTTGGYAPFSQDIIISPTPNVTLGLQLLDVEVINITSTNANLRWRYKVSGENEETPQSLMINIEELDAALPESCCINFTPLEIPAGEPLSYQELEIASLQPAVKYSVSLRPLTDTTGGWRKIEFSTPPPPLPVALPQIMVEQGAEDWSWLLQDGVSDANNTHHYGHLVMHNMLLVLPEDYSWVEDDGISHLEVSRLLKNTIKKPFFLASSYKNGSSIMLGDGSYGVSEVGSFNNTHLPGDATYQLAAVQITRYNDAFSTDILYSTPLKL